VPVCATSWGWHRLAHTGETGAPGPPNALLWAGSEPGPSPFGSAQGRLRRGHARMTASRDAGVTNTTPPRRPSCGRGGSLARAGPRAAPRPLLSAACPLWAACPHAAIRGMGPGPRRPMSCRRGVPAPRLLRAVPMSKAPRRGGPGRLGWWSQVRGGSVLPSPPQEPQAAEGEEGHRRRLRDGGGTIIGEVEGQFP